MRIPRQQPKISTQSPLQKTPEEFYIIMLEMILTQHHRVSKKSLLSIYSDVTKKEREKERKEIHVKDLNTTLFYFSGNFHLFFLTFFFFKMVFFNYICKKMFHQPEPVCSVQRLRCHFVLFLNVVVCGTFSNFFFFSSFFFHHFRLHFLFLFFLSMWDISLLCWGVIRKEYGGYSMLLSWQ